MTPKGRKAADGYFAEAKSWASERGDDMRRSRTIAWIVAMIAAGIAIVEGVAILALVPLKTVVPYTLLVDRQTGYVQALDPIVPSSIAPDTALTQSFLVQYVLAREGFDAATVQGDYRKVLLWSVEGARSDYAAFMPVTNADSPLVRLPRGTVIEARTRSVSSLGGRTALVRFDTIRRDRGGTTQPPQSWVAVVEYRYSTNPLSAEDRFLNPLGFQVTRYRRSAETPPAPADNAPAGVNTNNPLPVTRADEPGSRPPTQPRVSGLGAQ